MIEQDAANAALRQAELVAELLEERGEVGDLARPQALEELRCAQRGAHLPAQAGGAVGRHLVRRVRRHGERLTWLVAALGPADGRAHRALEDLEALLLARVQVRRRHGAAA